MSILQKNFPEIYQIIEAEKDRQNNSIELIASENFTSPAVMEAAGTVLTNKYAEGYPGNRYYGGCQQVDRVETLAIDLARQLFGADHANVQPHSGSSANLAVYFASLPAGATILGMDLSHGGHLTHGSPVNISGKYFRFIHYGVSRETETLDYGQMRSLALEHRPAMIVAGASAYPRVIDFALIREICDQVGALFMVDMAHIAGLVAAGLHPSPIPHADFVTTTTHKTLRGPRGGIILCRQKYSRIVDKAIFPGIQGGPLMHIIAAKAVALKEALTSEFREYQGQVLKNARVLATALQSRQFRLVSGGTDNHLLMVDLSGTGVTGQEVEHLLDQVGITVNKNTIPFETLRPTVTSGIRIGTPAVTTRGMKEPEMEEIACFIHQAIACRRQEEKMVELAGAVKDLCGRFPLYR